jgi:hypothetical protein
MGTYPDKGLREMRVLYILKFNFTLTALMRAVLISALVLGLCACSKEPQDFSSLSLTIDGKPTLTEKAESGQLPKFQAKHAPLIDALTAACENSQRLADLRKILETIHKMNSSADIEYVQKKGLTTGAKTLVSANSSWTIKVDNKGYSCSQTTDSFN